MTLVQIFIYQGYEREKLSITPKILPNTGEGDVIQLTLHLSKQNLHDSR